MILLTLLLHCFCCLQTCIHSHLDFNEPKMSIVSEFCPSGFKRPLRSGVGLSLRLCSFHSPFLCLPSFFIIDNPQTRHGPRNTNTGSHAEQWEYFTITFQISQTSIPISIYISVPVGDIGSRNPSRSRLTPSSGESPILPNTKRFLL